MAASSSNDPLLDDDDDDDLEDFVNELEGEMVIDQDIRNEVIEFYNEDVAVDEMIEFESQWTSTQKNNAFDRLTAPYLLEYAGPMDSSKDLWRQWIRILLEERERLTEVSNERGILARTYMEFATNQDWQEDMDPTIGPRDSGRSLTWGFERFDPIVAGKVGDIVWQLMAHENNDPIGRWVPLDNEKRSPLAVKQALDAAQLRLPNGRVITIAGIRPMRRVKTPAELHVLKTQSSVSRNGRSYMGGNMRLERDVFGLKREDEQQSGIALQRRIPVEEQSLLKMVRIKKGDGANPRTNRILRDGTGQPILRARERLPPRSTDAIRMQVMSVRLNEHHWEWMYSDFLENDQMFDTPSMTPYLHNDEFKLPKGADYPHETQAAIPLLTRGTMGFDGVMLSSSAAGDAKPKLAIASLQDLRDNWSSTRLRGLPRIHQDIQTTTIGKELGKGTSRNAYTSDNQQITCLRLRKTPGSDEPGEVCWKTVFKIGDDYHINAFYGDDSALMPVLGVSGYNSWGNGDASQFAGPLLTQTLRVGSDKRHEQVFRGLPLYFGKVGAIVPEDCPLLDNPTNEEKRGNTIKGYFGDVRVRGAGHEGEVGTGQSKDYTEVYRELMWKPQPVRAVRTLPGAGAAFRSTSETKTKDVPSSQIPRYLTFTPSERSHTRNRTSNQQAQEDERARNQYNLEGGIAPLLGDPQGDREHGNSEIHVPLLQHYPEVLMAHKHAFQTRIRQTRSMLNPSLDKKKGTRKEARDKRIADARALFVEYDGDPEAFDAVMKRGYKGYQTVRSQKVLADAQFGRRQVRAFYRLFEHPNFANLSPTTMRGVVARYVSSNTEALAYYNKDEPAKKLEGLYQQGGLYFSCRIDTGTGPRQGGLDTFLPVDIDSDVYDISDLALARGVHDMLYTPPEGVPVGSNPGFSHRAGAPDWWTNEQTAMVRNATLDIDPYQTPYRNVRGNVRSIWTNSEDDAYTLRATYMPGDNDPRQLLFHKSQLRRLDTAEASAEKTFNASSLHRALAKTLGDGALPSHLTPTQLVVNRQVTNTGSKQANVQSVLFNASIPDASNLSPSEVAKQIVEALPHHHDLRVPCLPLYPTLLNVRARRLVWHRIHSLRKREGMGAPPEVRLVRDGVLSNRAYYERTEDASVPDMPEQTARRNKGYDETRETRGTGARTLVTPLYVVALDFDDFQRAVARCDEAWTQFFESHPHYWEFKERFLVVQPRNGGSAYIEANPSFVYPGSALPPRVDGKWETHDGPWKDATLRFATGSTDDEKRHAVRLASRPAMRTRASWFEDRLRFGGRGGAAGAVSSERQAFKNEVATWEALYQSYTQDQALNQDLRIRNGQLATGTSTLRTASVQLCWALSKLGEQAYATDPTTLFQTDDNLPQLSDADLARQGMASPEARAQTTSWIMRYPLVVWLLDTLDCMQEIRDQIQVFEQLQMSYLLGNEASKAVKDVLNGDAAGQFKHLANFLSMPRCEWPSESHVDDLSRKAGATAGALVLRLEGTAEVWSEILGHADRLYSDPARSSRYKLAASNSNEESGAGILRGIVQLLRDNTSRHLLDTGMRQAFYLLLDAWATYIYETRTNTIRAELATPSDETRFSEEDIVSDTLRAQPKELMEVSRSERGVDDLLGVLKLFGHMRVEEWDEPSEYAATDVLYEYARELRTVDALLRQQQRILGDDAFVMFGKDTALDWSRVHVDQRDDRRLIATTVDAFSRIFVSLQTAAKDRNRLDTLLGKLMGTAPLSEDEQSDLQTAYDKLQPSGRVMTQLREIAGRDADVPPMLLQAFATVSALVQENASGATAGQREEEARRREEAFAITEMEKRMRRMAVNAKVLQKARDAANTNAGNLDRLIQTKTSQTAPETEIRDLKALLERFQKTGKSTKAKFERMARFTKMIKDKRNPAILNVKNDDKYKQALVVIWREMTKLQGQTRTAPDLVQPLTYETIGPQTARQRVLERMGMATVVPVHQNPMTANLDAAMRIFQEDIDGPSTSVQNPDEAMEVDEDAGMDAETEEPEGDRAVNDLDKRLDRRVLPTSPRREDDVPEDTEVAQLEYRLSVVENVDRNQLDDEDVFLIGDEFAAMQRENDDRVAELQRQSSAEHPLGGWTSVQPMGRPPLSPPASPPSMEPSLEPTGRDAFNLENALMPMKPIGPDRDESRVMDWLAEQLRKKKLKDDPDKAKDWMAEFGEEQAKEAEDAQSDEAFAQMLAVQDELWSLSEYVQYQWFEHVNQVDAQRRAIARVRAYLRDPEFEASEAYAAEKRGQLERLNAELRLVPYTDDGITTDEYRDQLKGVGIEDPDACNDTNVDVIDPRELYGWKGQYRRHVSGMIRVSATGISGPSYYLDAVPPTPHEWLASAGAKRGPNPPTPPTRDEDAEQRAAMLQATSLAQGVEAIVGDETLWTGQGEEARGETAGRVKARLGALLLAERAFLMDPKRGLYEPFAFDLDSLDASNVIGV